METRNCRRGYVRIPDAKTFFIAMKHSQNDAIMQMYGWDKNYAKATKL